MKVTTIEIADLAVKLYQLSGCQNASYSDEAFKAKFGFAFDLLVDAELQLGNLSKQTLANRRPARPDFS